MRRSPIVLLIVLVALVAACTSTGKPQPSASGTGPAASRQATSPAASPSNGSNTDVGAPDMVLLHHGDGLAVVEAGSGQIAYDAPGGVTSSDWHFVYSVAVDGKSTTVTKTDLIRGGEKAASTSIAGLWRLPTIAAGQDPAGIASDTHTLVLEEAHPSTSTTRFAIVSGDLSMPARIVTLAGRFTFDGISPDGSRLYVIEYLGAKGQEHYAVRSVLAGALEEGVIVDKRESDEAMVGTPIDRTADRGMAYTLYLGEHGPFVHALDTTNRVAFCIDLPAAWGGSGPSASGWSVAFGATSDELYAVNPRLGVAAAIDVKQFEVRRMATFQATASIELTKFLGAPGSAGAAVVSPDGSTLYALDSRGVLVISTKDLKPRGRLLADRQLVGLAISADGTSLYVSGTDGSALRVDPNSGSVIGRFSGTRFGRILMVMQEPR